MTHLFSARRGRITLAASLLLAAAWPGPARAETLTLAECLRETAEHNPDVRRERAAIEQAAGTRLALRARALPSLGIGGLAGQLGAQNNETVRAPVPLKAADGTVVVQGGKIVYQRDANGNVVTQNVVAVRRNASLVAVGTGSLNQALFDAAIPASYRRGTAEVLAAQENFYTVASQQLHAARTEFLRAYYQQENGRLLRRSDAVFGEDVQTQNNLVAAGLAGRAALLSAQVQRAGFAPNILGASGNFRVTAAQLLQTMGRDPGPGGSGGLDGLSLADPFDETALEFDPAGAAREALDRRPDLRALRALVSQYREDARIVRAGYYPLLRLYVAGELLPQTSTRSNNPNAVRATDQVQTTELRPGVQGSWTVIDTGGVRGGAGNLDAQRAAIELSLRRLERNLPAELATVRARLADAAGTAAALRGNAETAQSTLDIIRAGVAQGVNSQLEFLDAQSGLLATQTTLLGARLEMSLQHAEFDRLTGRYLRYVADEDLSPGHRPATLHPAPSPAAHPAEPRS